MNEVQIQECSKLRQVFSSHCFLSVSEFTEKYCFGSEDYLRNALRLKWPLSAKIAICMRQETGIPIEEFSPRLADLIKVEQRSVPTETTREIPLLTLEEVYVADDIKTIQANETLTANCDLPVGCFAVRVEDDALSPSIVDGDIVIANPWLNPKPSDFIVTLSRHVKEKKATVLQYIEVDYYETVGIAYEARPIAQGYKRMHSMWHSLELLGVVVGLVRRFG